MHTGIQRAILAAVIVSAVGIGLWGLSGFRADMTEAAAARLQVHRATGSASINSTLAATTHPKLVHEVRVHLGETGNTAELFTATIDSASNAVYDSVIISQSLNAITDYRYTTPFYVYDGDEVDFSWLNTPTHTYGLEVYYENVY